MCIKRSCASQLLTLFSFPTWRWEGEVFLWLFQTSLESFKTEKEHPTSRVELYVYIIKSQLTACRYMKRLWNSHYPEPILSLWWSDILSISKHICIFSPISLPFFSLPPPHPYMHSYVATLNRVLTSAHTLKCILTPTHSVPTHTCGYVNEITLWLQANLLFTHHSAMVFFLGQQI